MHTSIYQFLATWMTRLITLFKSLFYVYLRRKCKERETNANPLLYFLLLWIWVQWYGVATEMLLSRRTIVIPDLVGLLWHINSHFVMILRILPWQFNVNISSSFSSFQSLFELQNLSLLSHATQFSQIWFSLKFYWFFIISSV